MCRREVVMYRREVAICRRRGERGREVGNIGVGII